MQKKSFLVLAVLAICVSSACTSIRATDPAIPAAERIQPGQDLILTLASGEKIGGKVRSVDAERVVLEHGEDTTAVPLGEIRGIAMREVSPTKTAAAGVGVLWVFGIASLLSAFGVL